MLRILDRLDRSLMWRLLSPPENLPAGLQHRATTEHSRLLAAVQSARALGYGVAEPLRPAEARTGDTRAAHVLAMDRDGAIAGAVRMLVVHRAREALTAGLLEDFARATFPTPDIRSCQLSALDRWLASTSHEVIFIYAGGFFTTERWRGSGLSAALGMAAIAMARLHGSRHSASFASMEGQAPLLFKMLGARPLEVTPGVPLEPFTAPKYDIKLRLVSFDSQQPDPAIETAVQQVTAQLRQMTALAPLMSLDAAEPTAVQNQRAGVTL